MPISISLDAISRLDDSDQFSLARAPGGVKTTGFWHRVKCLFNIFGARQENKDTIREIKAAIDSHPVYSRMDDIKARAEVLLDQVRTDKALNARQIKGILLEIERLAGSTAPAIRERAMMSLATCTVPREWSGSARDEIINCIADQISSDRIIRMDPGRPNFRQRAQEMIDSLEDAGRRLRGPNRFPDPRLVLFCAHHLVPLIWKEDARGARTLRSDAELADRMEALRKFLAAADARAQQTNKPGLADRALKLLGGLAALPDPTGVFAPDAASGETRLENLIKTLPLSDLERFDAGALSPGKLFNDYLASRQPPAPGAAKTIRPGTPEWPKLGMPREFASFFKSLDSSSRFGEVVPYGQEADAAGDTKQAFAYRGLVFMRIPHDRPDPEHHYGFSSDGSLSKPGDLTQAKGLGRKNAEDAAATGWGDPGTHGVPTAKTLEDVFRHGTGLVDKRGGTADRLYVIDTTAFAGNTVFSWDMESAVYGNGYKQRGAEDETHGKVNCSTIPFFSVVGWVDIPPEVSAAADPDEAVRRLVQLPEEKIHYNFTYFPRN